MGGLIGNAKGKIYNSSFAQSIYVACEMSAIVGGIAGKFDGNICQAYSLVDIEVVSSDSNVKIGGLVAELDGEDNAISTCYYSGKICYSSINRLQQTELEDRVGYVIGECLSESLNVTYVYYTNNNIDSASRLFPSSVVGYCRGVLTSENITNNIILIELENLTSGELIDGFGRYISQQDLNTNAQNVWQFKEGDFPILYYQSYEE